MILAGGISMSKQENRKMIIAVEKFVQKKLGDECTGHDWRHTFRVRDLALYIAKNEAKLKPDLLLVELAALLHDIVDWKFNENHDELLKKYIITLKIDQEIQNKIIEIINNPSFKGAKTKTKKLSVEGRIVQDADRLDAIGAIGIARAFAYGGFKQRLIYDPKIKPAIHKTFAAYKNKQSTTINHFYEKLLLLQGLMHTQTARKLARKRHKYMVNFLTEFYREWNSEQIYIPFNLKLLD
jgi:uncharacterized protein